MSKKDSIFQIMSLKDTYQKKRTKNVIGLMKNELGEIMTEFVGLRAKTYNYLVDYGSENKKAKVTKRCVIKRNLKFEYHKNSLEATQFENIIKHLEKNKTDVVLKKIAKNL